MKIKKNIILCLMVFGLTLIGTMRLFAQGTINGVSYLQTGDMVLFNGVHNFNNGGNGLTAGIIVTNRNYPQGYLTFLDKARVSGVSNLAHVDGYVKSTLDTTFIFPIGDNGVYAPCAVKFATKSNPVDAAYFNVSPNTAITSNYFSGVEPVLPSNGPFPAEKLDLLNLTKVSDIEYWDINGSESADFSLSWSPSSNIAALCNNNLNNLTIAGWNTITKRWEIVPSSVDVTSIFKTSSTLNGFGSISTSTSVVPNLYAVYTLAGMVPEAVGTVTCSNTTISPAPETGKAIQTVMTVTMNVDSIGCFTPITVSGSGMTIANNLTQICTNSKGQQQFKIPLNYDGTTLGLMTFTIGKNATCSLNLKIKPTEFCTDVWTIDYCTIPPAGPQLK